MAQPTLSLSASAAHPDRPCSWTHTFDKAAFLAQWSEDVDIDKVTDMAPKQDGRLASAPVNIVSRVTPSSSPLPQFYHAASHLRVSDTQSPNQKADVSRSAPPAPSSRPDLDKRRESEPNEDFIADLDARLSDLTLFAPKNPNFLLAPTLYVAACQSHDPCTNPASSSSESDSGNSTPPSSVDLPLVSRPAKSKIPVPVSSRRLISVASSSRSISWKPR